MESLTCKTRLAVLWLIQSINLMAYLMLNVMLRAAGIIQAGSAEEVNASAKLVMIIFFIYLLMAWLSLTLKDAGGRLINLVLGILFAILLALTGVSAIRAGAPSPIVVSIFWAFVVFLLTIWYSWKWPRQQA
jgi:heme A synthase